MAWLHWIGKVYYRTPKKFIKEAQLQGITRRVAPKVLARMNWDDGIYCIQAESGKKWGSVFLRYRITRLSGLSQAAQMELERLYDVQMIEPGGDHVSRECGDYISGATYSISGATLSDIGALLVRLKGDGVDIGQPMVGCGRQGFNILEKPWAILNRVPFRPGFRPFNAMLFNTLVSDMRQRQPGKRPIVKGEQFYIVAMIGTDREGVVQVVTDYNKK